jgi:acetylornithine/succinyldiaminopimelate/putrescine aminotransferase
MNITATFFFKKHIPIKKKFKKSKKAQIWDTSGNEQLSGGGAVKSFGNIHLAPMVAA